MKRLFLASLALLITPIAALAHQSRAPSDQSGIAIPAVTHGEMAILVEFRPRVIQLARSTGLTDPDFRVLLNYTEIQHAMCLWNAVPRTIGDEASPFNECAHADLAAAKSLLLYMRNMPGIGPQASDLNSEYEKQVILSGAQLIGCQYSGEAYNSAEFIAPHWSDIPFHGPSLACFSIIAALLGAPILALTARGRGAARVGA